MKEQEGGRRAATGIASGRQPLVLASLRFGLRGIIREGGPDSFTPNLGLGFRVLEDSLFGAALRQTLHSGDFQRKASSGFCFPHICTERPRRLESGFFTLQTELLMRPAPCLTVGTIMDDATSAPNSARNAEKKRPRARKGNRRYCGARIHAGVDAKTVLAHNRGGASRCP